MKSLIVAFFFVACLCTGATRLKELAGIEGVRENQLIGYGLVVGLNGTGDRRQTLFSAQSLSNLLQQMGVTVPAQAMRVNNTAAVMVTSSLPPFARPGARIDITAAAIGDATNLQGGLLVMTSLRGVDGQIYAVAQGPLVTGGFVAGPGGNRQTVNHPTVGRVANGATVERAVPTAAFTNEVRLQLKHADFTTAARVAEALNRQFGADTPVAHAENAAAVTVAIPKQFASRPTEFIAALESVSVDADRIARIVINERTGTIVMGKDVQISPVAVMHGNLSIEITTSYDVSQPAPFSQGATQVVPNISVGVKEEKARNLVIKQGATVEELVRSLNGIGVTPRDVIAILQNIKVAGALAADIEVI
ncbi:MAG TPA: flagellar basal body P-ring protein FlgI [Bryobacteraceae bacterium]|nr:flagellar basal body P-ring protein FlgI [Bryobacteraceae bacterium]